MVVIAKNDIDGVCKKGQRMFITTHFGENLLHIAAANCKKVKRKWIEQNFEIIKEGY